MSLIQNRNELNTSEYLSNDILDEKFVKVFKPFRIVQIVLGSCRVDIRDHFVTGPSILQKCYTIVCTALIIFASYSTKEAYSKRFSNNQEMTNLWTAIIYGVLVVYLISVTITRFYNNKGNVNLYVKMQKIDRVMKLDENERINTKHYIQNYAVVVVLTIIFALIVVSSILVAHDELGLVQIVGTTWTLNTLMLELCCCSSHLLYFTVRIRLINSIVANHFRKRHVFKTNLHLCKPWNAEWESFDTCDTDVYLIHVLNGFKYFQDQYKFQIFCFCAQLVAWILFSMEYAILALKSTFDMSKLLLDLAHLGLMCFIHVALLCALCVLSEIFYREVDKTKKLSIFVLSRYIDGPLRQKAKYMLKLIEEMPPCFSVYGMWRVDARLLLNIFHITSTFLVIILQFAFL